MSTNDKRPNAGPSSLSPRRPAEATPSGVPATGVPASPSTSAEVADFVRQVHALAPRTGGGRGRLVFAMDATMSRRPTWDMALSLQADMFAAVKAVGGLDVQLVYFRGLGECRASRWVSDPDALSRLMTSVECLGGRTQIARVLAHTRSESEQRRVNALVYVGDSMEEKAEALYDKAGELALLGVPVFAFQEGSNRTAETTFREIARLSRGAYCPFDAGSASQLRDLLMAVAVYAAGGRTALEQLALAGGRPGATLLLRQLS